MTPKTISMCGAAWHRSHIISMSREEFIAYGLSGSAFRDKVETTRSGMFGQVWDLAMELEPVKAPAKPKAKKK